MVKIISLRFAARSGAGCSVSVSRRLAGGGRSVEEAAQLAGMEASEWSAVEAGFVPDPAKLRPMADALELRYDRIATMAVLCRDAWEQ